jgi:serine/threonine protein kinase/tetratricopeptide (TPR) repeat protein
MTALDNWPKVKLVLDAALARDGADREAYLVEACGHDLALRAQINRLLAAEHDAHDFLETPALLQLERPAVREDLSGLTVNSYRLISRLGAGGMGDVYLAHDAKLDRPVALKFLSPDLAADQERLQRFHQEARAASSLNHPHIVVVHDFGELTGRPYIVTEFVEGRTVRTLLGSGSLPVRDVVEIGIQIAGALAAAHARGIVHRDVKPDNVMVRPDGYVKVVDFGLAMTAVAGSSGDAHLPRTAGTVVGTPRYMSPEQAQGGEVDASSDVWSLGVVLYEMIAGRPPFEGATPADAIATLLNTEPVPLDAYAPHAPAPVCAVVMKALRKKRDQRYVDAEAMLAALRRTLPAIGSTPSGASVSGVGDADDDSVVSTTGERRRVAVLVSLVSDYASLLERLTSHELEHLIALIRAAAVDTMRRHGGVVNQSIGEEIVSLFGITAADEDDDLRAVRAALELHARVVEIGSTFAESAGASVRLQSGLHAGSVVAQRLREGPRRYAVTGPPAQTAARLAAAAEADVILLSPDCQRQVAPFVRTEAHAPLVLHANTSPLTPHRVLGESGLNSRLEAPGHAGLTPYTGREAELATLREQVMRAEHGAGRLVLIVGEAGSGKSRMLHELRGDVSRSDVLLLSGRCRSSDGMTSYLPFIELLHAALGMRVPDDDKPADDQIVARMRAIAPSLEPFIPLYLHLLAIQSRAWPVPRHLRGEHLQAAMLDALTTFFTAYAQGKALVLLLEDWHWADDASRRTLQRLADVVDAYPLVIAATTRTEAGLLPASDRSLRIDLGPLGFHASQAIMRAVLGIERPPDDLARRLHERTGGNPFFLEEMCHGLREAGLVMGSDGQAVINGSTNLPQLPDSVQAVIRSRLDRLHQADREVVRLASVVGREFTRQILHDATGGGDLGGALDRLTQAGIIQQLNVAADPLYRFKHVLSQEVAYESLLEHQRRALHQAVGSVIERQHSDPPEPLELLAHHYSRAEAWSKAIEFGMRAAERATELSQVADALSMLQRVQSWWERLPDGPARREHVADVLLKQERLCETLGMRGRQIQLADELIALLAPSGASARLAEAYLRRGDVSTLLKRFDASDRALATALRMSRERGDAALERNALRSIGLLRWHQGRHEDALAITEQALAIDRARQDDLAVAGDLSNLGNILLSLGRHSRALTILEEALAMPAVAGDPIKRAYVLHIFANVHRAEGNLDRALDYLQRADESARVHMLPIQRSFHLTSMAHIHLQNGQLDDCLRLYRDAVELSRRARHADGLAQSLKMLGEVLFAIGRDQEGLPHLQEAAQLFAQLEDRDAEALLSHHGAVVLERCAQPGAMAAWERVRALAQAAGAAHTELAALEGIARMTRRRAPASDEAIRGFDDALALALRLGEHEREVAIRNTLGVLHWERGGYGDALVHYEAALSLSRALGHRPHEGVILNSVGVVLSRMRRYEEARTALDEALSVNRAAGERLLEAHTLAALGEVAVTLGRYDAALEHFAGALSIRRSLDDRRGEAWMLHHVARVRGLTGDHAGAERSATLAARIAAECDDLALRRACGLIDGDPVRASQHSMEN